MDAQRRFRSFLMELQSQLDRDEVDLGQVRSFVTDALIQELGDLQPPRQQPGPARPLARPPPTKKPRMMPPAQPRALLETGKLSHGPSASGYVKIDCTELRDSSTKRFKNHCGLHPELLHALVRMSDFRAVLLEVAHLQLPHQDLRISFMCKSGYHRSPSVCRAVELILLEQGFRVETTHRELEFRDTHVWHTRASCADCDGSLDSSGFDVLWKRWTDAVERVRRTGFKHIENEVKNGLEQDS